MDMKTEIHNTDICVVGGGMSGLCAAVAAARHGSKVVLMHDRPVLGGNASSENRMYIRGATSANLEYRETGIVQEIELENIYRNPTMNFSIWDTVLYQFVLQEPNITLLLNCSCLSGQKENEKIVSVTGWQLNTYTFHTVNAKIFVDCSGDSIFAELFKVPYRVGREGREEFNEYGAPEEPDRFTMGSTCLIQARETDHPCTFIPPEWAYTYPDDESMYLKNHDIIRTKVNFWWIELGGEQDTIRDTQAINEELIKTAYGVWDHIKNHGDHGMDNWELEWIGFLPSKRESRRYEGAYILNQRDLEEGHHFDDTVAFGGWTMDNHSPKGFKTQGYSSTHIKTKVPYEIPLRCLYSTAMTNLMFAGRNISATHMAMSSTRVMATCALLGQAVGTAASLAIEKKCIPADIAINYISRLQDILQNDGCYIPGLLRSVRVDIFPGLSEKDISVLRNGWERPHNLSPNTISFEEGESVVIELVESGTTLRLALDPDFSRESITSDSRFKKYAMRSHLMLADKPLNMPANLLRSCEIVFHISNGEEVKISIYENRKPRLFIQIPKNTKKIEIAKMSSWGEKKVNFFACDIM